VRTLGLRRIPPLVALAGLFTLPALVLVVLRVVPAIDVTQTSVHFHLWIVSGIAGCASIVALAAARSAGRVHHHGPVWLAIGCLVVTALMFAHGLMTPGVHHRAMNTWVGRLPFIAIPGFAVCLLLASRPRNARTSRLVAQRPRAAVGTAAVLLAAFVIALHRHPHIWWGARPLPHEELIQSVLLFGTAPILAVVAWRHWWNYRLGGDRVQLALVATSAMGVAAICSMHWGELWQLSWWNYHIFLLIGFASAVYAIVVRCVREGRVADVFAQAFDTDAMVHLVEGYPEALRTLVRAVELKDAYTAGHSERTAATALHLGLRLGVPVDVLRAVARGGYLHDVGKITIPDAILNKPDRLDAEERAVIETHPRSGYELVLPAIELHECLGAVLHHHERWDGTGYPGRLVGDEIPLIARVVAVADVWDALTSDRSYRLGMDPEVALGHIVAGRGTHFDPQVVDVFVALAADWGYSPAREGDAETAWSAAQTCHEATATTRA
jgi:hypothetical protein